MKILSVGTIAFDSIETPFGKKEKILGGTATFIGLAASILKVPIHLVSAVGEDFPQSYLKLLKSKNINIEAVEIIPNKETFFWHGKYEKNINIRNTIVTKLNVFKNFKPIIPECFKSDEILLLGNLDPEIQLSILNQIKNSKLIILDTMNFWINYNYDLLLKVIKKTDVIILNDIEAIQISKEYNLIKSAKKIHSIGPKFVIIKKGENGALLFSEGKIFTIPGFPIEKVCDPTGAGDTFAGGFASYLAKYEDLNDFILIKNAVVYANILASFCVEKFGVEGIQSITMEELNIRLKKFKDMTSF